jgi:subtilisin family serine protease
MAAAHIAGVAACFLSADPGMTPLDISVKLWSFSTQDAISGVPAGTVDAFVYNGAF